RLQYVANHLYPIHPQNRAHYDQTTLWKCIDEITVHLENLMALRDEAGHASAFRNLTDDGIRTLHGDPTR
ncbi:hypothetical protein Dimus_033806, partial [Dionaea muscipula]